MAKFLIDQQRLNPEEFCDTYLSSSNAEWRDISDWTQDWLAEKPFLKVQTSGSTGQPKKMTFPRAAFEASAALTAAHFGLKKGSLAVLALPIIYIAGKMMVTRALVNDWDLLLLSPSSHPKLPEHAVIDFLALTPMQVDGMKDEALEQVKTLIVGGAPLSHPQKQRLAHLPTTSFETYGMTETLTHIATRKIEKPLAEQRFTALEGIDLKQDADGKLLIKAPHIQPDWIATNDLVRMYSPTSFELIGRADDVINSGGIKLFPQELETKMAHLLPNDFYITSQEDELLGEKAVLVVEGTPFSTNEHAALIQKLRELLPATHVPKELYFKAVFERTASGKIIRSQALA